MSISKIRLQEWNIDSTINVPFIKNLDSIKEGVDDILEEPLYEQINKKEQELKELKARQALENSSLGPLEDLGWTMEVNEQGSIIIFNDRGLYVGEFHRFSAVSLETIAVINTGTPNKVNILNIPKTTENGNLWDCSNIITWELDGESEINPEMDQLAANIYNQGFSGELSYLEGTGYFQLSNTNKGEYRLFDKDGKQFIDENGKKTFDRVVNNELGFVTISGETAVININNGENIICENIEENDGWQIPYDILIRFLKKENFTGKIYKIFPYSTTAPGLMSVVYVKGEEEIYIDRHLNKLDGSCKKIED